MKFSNLLGIITLFFLLLFSCTNDESKSHKKIKNFSLEYLFLQFNNNLLDSLCKKSDWIIIDNKCLNTKVSNLIYDYQSLKLVKDSSIKSKLQLVCTNGQDLTYQSMVSPWYYLKSGDLDQNGATPEYKFKSEVLYDSQYSYPNGAVPFTDYNNQEVLFCVSGTKYQKLKVEFE